MILVMTVMALCLGPACARQSPVIETGEGTEPASEQEPVLETETVQPSYIYVYICGQVAAPGVYPMPPDARLFQAVDAAGGILPEGNMAAVNMAAALEDGQKVYIPALGEAASGGAAEGNTPMEDTGRVRINQASKESLMTLPGIGEKKAEAIIAYREKTGPFKTEEDLMQVPGIKAGIYDKIKDLIDID